MVGRIYINYDILRKVTVYSKQPFLIILSGVFNKQIQKKWKQKIYVVSYLHLEHKICMAGISYR